MGINCQPEKIPVSPFGLFQHFLQFTGLSGGTVKALNYRSPERISAPEFLQGLSFHPFRFPGSGDALFPRYNQLRYTIGVNSVVRRLIRTSVT